MKKAVSIICVLMVSISCFAMSAFASTGINPTTGEAGISPIIIVLIILAVLVLVACMIIPIINKKNK